MTDFNINWHNHSLVSIDQYEAIKSKSDPLEPWFSDHFWSSLPFKMSEFQDDFSNSMCIFVNQLSEWELSFMGCYPGYPGPLGMLCDGLTTKFEMLNNFMKFRINFLSEAPWSLFKISDLEAKIWKSASDVKLWNFVFFWNSSLSQSKTSPRRWECPKSTREMCFLYFSHFLSFGYFTSKFNILRCSTEEIDLGFWENIDISKFLCYPVTKHPQCTGLVGVTFDETHFQFQTLVRKYLHGIWKNNLKFTHFEGKWW